MSAPSSQSSTVTARLATDEATARRVSDMISELCDGDDVVAAAFEDAGAWAAALYFASPPDEPAVRALVGTIAGADAAEALVFSRVAEKDWVRASLEGLAPVTAGRVMVHGSHDRARVAPNRIGIEIEAALAFGTGHHGTTLGCLLALNAVAKRQHPRRILDLGTGSGVLAIAAAKLLRRPILASDIDRQAVRTAHANVRLNTARDIRLVHAAGLQSPPFRRDAPFDLVFANILLAPLKGLARPMRPLLAPGATVILSGLLAAQANAALAAYRAHGLILERRILRDGWATLILRLPAGRVAAPRNRV
ncbi:MAG TPA: 50S ribosomal protein L11 methyltransferase [Xanthobacteraceae bacterium]|jgi:ribosomal protein L11 methyltransferase|nr:50S ribosomal protein L11 methyltransferase [Xanthobacteraceae bacterium]